MEDEVNGSASAASSCEEQSLASAAAVSGNTSPSRNRASGKKKVTVPKPFNLTLHSRGAERQKYNVGQKMKLEEQERLIKEQQEIQEELERQEIRKRQGFKANRVRTYKKVAIMPSQRPLTDPESPRLRTARLDAMRQIRAAVLREQNENEEEEEEREMMRERGANSRGSSDRNMMELI